MSPIVILFLRKFNGNLKKISLSYDIFVNAAPDGVCPTSPRPEHNFVACHKNRAKKTKVLSEILQKFLRKYWNFLKRFVIIKKGMPVWGVRHKKPSHFARRTGTFIYSRCEILAELQKRGTYS